MCVCESERVYIVCACVVTCLVVCVCVCFFCQNAHVKRTDCSISSIIHQELSRCITEFYLFLLGFHPNYGCSKATTDASFFFSGRGENILGNFMKLTHFKRLLPGPADEPADSFSPQRQPLSQSWLFM